MNAQTWSAATDPQAMLQFLRSTANERKLRLFACGCCRLIWDRLVHQESRDAVEAAERYADGQLAPLEAQERRGVARLVSAQLHRQNPDDPRQYLLLAPYDALSPNAFEAASTAAIDSGWSAEHDGLSDPARQREQCELIRDIFGYPFEAIVFDRRWITLDVIGVARRIYADREFSLLPIVGDALRDAGCNDERILAHCKNGGLHVRGCWLVDSLLDGDS